MKTQEKSMMKKFSVIVFIATILMTNVYGQERLVRGALPPSSATVNAAKWDSVNKPIKGEVEDTKIEYNAAARDKKIESTVKSDLENATFYVPYTGFCRHEFLTWLGGGISTLGFNPTFGDKNFGLGGMFGLGYGLHFNPHWSLGIGAEIALYNMKMEVDGLKDSYSIDDQDGHPIDYYAEIKHYVEKQRLYSINIPLWLQYQTPVGDNGHEFYAALGAKLGIPLSGKYKSDDAQFDTYGYYDRWNVTLYDQRDLGYGDNTGNILREDLKFNLVCLGMVETGVIWNVGNPRLNLYTGLFLDYGFNDIVKTRNTKFLEYNYQNPENFKNNSVLTSEYKSYGKTDDFLNRVTPFALGLKVRLGFNVCTNKRTERPKVIDTREEAAVVKEDPKPAAAAPVKPIDYTPTPERKEPYYKSDPLLEAEMKRASAEYGKLADVIVLQVDGYEVNQSKLSPIMEKMIDEKIRLLQKYNSDKYTIICEGHTCDLGREEFNLNLGQKRAEGITEYLQTKGFKGENLVAASKGKISPIVPNTSEANRKINRRVVFLIKEK